MRSAIASALELAGLIVAAIGLVLGLSGAKTWVELGCLAAGVVLFIGGRALAGTGGGAR